jgi:hypothetical protein
VSDHKVAIELGKRELEVEQQKPINPYYDGHVVGEYYADLVIVEVPEKGGVY